MFTHSSVHDLRLQLSQKNFKLRLVVATSNKSLKSRRFCNRVSAIKNVIQL